MIHFAQRTSANLQSTHCYFVKIVNNIKANYFTSFSFLKKIILQTLRLEIAQWYKMNGREPRGNFYQDNNVQKNKYQGSNLLEQIMKAIIAN